MCETLGNNIFSLKMINYMHLKFADTINNETIRGFDFSSPSFLTIVACDAVFLLTYKNTYLN